MNNPHFGTICLCALRYAIGRQTYMPGIVQNFIRVNIRDIDEQSIRNMICEIDENDKVSVHTLSDGSVLKIDHLGDSRIDRYGWERFREFLKDTLKNGTFRK